MVVLACVDHSEADIGTVLAAYESAARATDDLAFAVSYEKDVHSAAGCKHSEIIMYKRHSKESAVEELRFGPAIAAAAAVDIERWCVLALPLARFSHVLVGLAIVCQSQTLVRRGGAAANDGMPAESH